MFDPTYIDVEDYLDCLGIDIVRNDGSNVTFSCPLPAHADGDRHPSARMNLETTKWFCHGCKARGDAISFAALVLSISPFRAKRFLRERYDPGYADPYAVSTVDAVRKIFDRSKHDHKVENERLPEEVISRFSVDWWAAYKGWRAGEGFYGTDYMFDRGFHPITLEAWGVGWDSYYGRVTIPVRNIKGELIGFKGRAVEKERRPKYLVIGDNPDRDDYGWKPYHVSTVVFGADRAQNRLEMPLIVCEGELNVLALWQKSRYPSVAINGSNPSAEHAKIIREISDNVILFFDSDRAGDDATDAAVNLLQRYVKSIKIVQEHEGDPASMTQEQINDSIQGALPWTHSVVHSKLAIAGESA